MSTIRDLVKAIVKSKYPQHRIFFLDKAEKVLGYTIVCSLYRSVQLKTVVMVVVVSCNGQVILDLTGKMTTTYTLEEVGRKDVFTEVFELVKTNIIKRVLFVKDIREDKRLPSILTCSYTDELQIVYLDTSGSVVSVKPLNGVIPIDINDEEFSVIEKKFLNTGIEVERPKLKENNSLEEEILYVGTEGKVI